MKKVRVPAKVALDIAHSFQQDGREHFLDLLPALKRVEVLPTVGMDDLYDAFEPLIAATVRTPHKVIVVIME